MLPHRRQAFQDRSRPHHLASGYLDKGDKQKAQKHTEEYQPQRRQLPAPTAQPHLNNGTELAIGKAFHLRSISRANAKMP